MLHAKVQDHRNSSSGEEDFYRFLPYILYVRGSYLGHVTICMIILTKFIIPLPIETPHKIWLCLA